MSVCNKVLRPFCTISTTTSTSTSTQSICPRKKLSMERLLLKSINPNSYSTSVDIKPRLGKKWMEFQGIENWDDLLDPLDDKLRAEIIRYGRFVESSYKAFDFDQSSPLYGSCQYPKSSLLDQSGFPNTGYRVTKHLRATSSIQLPQWMEKGMDWVGPQSSWIGYTAVCTNKEEIARLGRRDIVIAYRGTGTCLEWLENLRATLTPLSSLGYNDFDPKVESGFLNLYNSGSQFYPSLQNSVREEVNRVLQTYSNEPLSLTITGHSLGAALAILTAYDIKSTFKNAPLVTVISFGGPRVGNQSFRCQLERKGIKILRIVNPDDLVTKLPGFVMEKHEVANTSYPAPMSNILNWIQERVEDTQWVYSEVGCELRLNSQSSINYVNGTNIATCHELKTYLHLIDGFVSYRALHV